MSDYGQGPPKEPHFAGSEYTEQEHGRRMDLGTLKALLDAQKVAALAAMQSSKLVAERDDALMYYVGDMSKDMPAPDGRSEAVSSDVQDTIEGLMPALMEIFTGSEEVVKFNPVGPEDVQAAEQETDYVNHVIMNENPGFMVLYHFIKDALLSKVGIVKCFWEEEAQEEKETYHDLTDDEFDILVSDPEVDIVQHTAKPADPKALAYEARFSNQGGGAGPQSAPPPGGAPSPSPQAPPTPSGAPQAALPSPAGYSPQGTPASQATHDVVVVKHKTYGRVKIAPVAPEEFGIEKTARTLRQGYIGGCNYCFHRVIRSQDDLIQQGFDEDQIRSLPTYMSVTNIEEINRDTVAEHQNVGEEMNPAGRRIEVIEHYVRMDYEGDGVAKLYQVFTGSEQGQILYKKIEGEDGEIIEEPAITEFDEVPFAAMTPIIVTHRFFGRSLADLTMDIQRIKTALLRGLLDNTYLANNPRVVVSETGASDSTLDDLLISRPGGIVRVKSDPGAVSWQEVPTIGSHVFPMLEYADSIREIRTGVTKQGTSLDADALQNQSATAVNHMFTMAQARMRLIARIFAETGIKDLCVLVHGLVRKHGQQAQTIRLKGSWVTVDPRDWKKRNDMMVDVGLGTGGKAEQMAMMNLIIGMQEKALMGGKTNLVTDDNLYNAARTLTRITGHKDVNAFFSDPRSQPPPRPPPNPDMIKAQIEQMKIQGQQQLQGEKMKSDVSLEQARMQADYALEQQKFEHQKELDLLEMGMKREEHGQKMQLEHHKAQTEMAKAEHQAQLNSAETGQKMQLGQQETQQKMNLNEQAAKHKKEQVTAKNQDASAALKPHIDELLDHLKKANSVKRVVRDKQGRISHLEAAD